MNSLTASNKLQVCNPKNCIRLENGHPCCFCDDIPDDEVCNECKIINGICIICNIHFEPISKTNHYYLEHSDILWGLIQNYEVNLPCDEDSGFCTTHKEPIEICSFDTDFNKDELSYMRGNLRSSKSICTMDMEINDKISIQLGELSIDEVLERREY